MSRLETKRRTFLTALAAVPGMNLLAGDHQAVAQETPPVRDVIAELGVRSFINAAGTFTALTGSLMRPEVVAAMQVASRKYVRIDDLHEAVGKRIAELLGCQAALVTSGCASALSLSTAACVAGKDAERIRRLPDTTGMKNEVLVQKTHRVGYDHAIRNAGVKMIEVETRSDLESAINERTAMMFFLNFANPLGQIHHQEFIEVARKYKIPTLIDAAADVPPVENLWRYRRRHVANQRVVGRHRVRNAADRVGGSRAVHGLHADVHGCFARREVDGHVRGGRIERDLDRRRHAVGHERHRNAFLEAPRHVDRDRDRDLLDPFDACDDLARAVERRAADRECRGGACERMLGVTQFFERGGYFVDEPGPRFRHQSLHRRSASISSTTSVRHLVSRTSS